jgi:hypothetical protein
MSKSTRRRIAGSGPPASPRRCAGLSEQIRAEMSRDIGGLLQKALPVGPEANPVQRPVCWLPACRILQQHPLTARKYMHSDPLIAAHSVSLVSISCVRCAVCTPYWKLKRERATVPNRQLERRSGETDASHITWLETGDQYVMGIVSIFACVNVGR